MLKLELYKVVRINLEDKFGPTHKLSVSFNRFDKNIDADELVPVVEIRKPGLMLP